MVTKLGAFSGVTPQACRLYLITPPAIDLASFPAALDAALSGGDVACLQLRLKPADDTTILAVGRVLVPIAQARGVAVLVNDRPDLAKALGADGVHLGQDDMSIPEARKILGASGLIGATCHASRHLAMEAGEQGADYVAFGAFFDTKTKMTQARPEPEILSWWSGLMEIPCVAIGGITPENAKPLIEAGADFLAVSSGVWNHPQGPKAAVAAFNALFSA